jgi:hypothetical protein
MTNGEIRAAVNQALRPECFFVARGSNLRIEYHPAAACPWEIFCGHLLGRSQTRLEKTFECWNVRVCHPEPSLSGPILSVKFSSHECVIYVTRSVRVFGWEPHDSAGNVITGRATSKWSVELVGTIDLAGVTSEQELLRRLSRAIFLGVIGTSRLPITSLESPLPGFSLGQLGYVPSRVAPGGPPLSSLPELLEQGLTAGLPLVERAKLLELVLRAAKPSDVPALAETYLERWQAVGPGLDEIPHLVRTMFNYLALSPYTGFVENLAVMLTHLAKQGALGPPVVIDILSYMLRHTVRHLTAFDLVTFHNAGANYPDALMLDTLLRVYCELLEQHRELFEDRSREDERPGHTKRRRRRALRQAWFIRKQYEGLPVPDWPTSPGENLRVLPEPFVQLPDEQIRQPGRRRTMLFVSEPADRLLNQGSQDVLEQSIEDLQTPEELRELGMAVYLDRPLGVFKQPGEVDRTPLLSYEAWSASIAERRLKQFLGWGLIPSERQYHIFLKRLHLAMPTRGYSNTELGGPERPGVVALEDARKAATDFRFLRTTRQSLTDFLRGYDFEPLHSREPELVHWLFSARHILLIRTGGIQAAQAGLPFLTVFDQALEPRLRLGLGQDPTSPVCYLEADGIEYLEQGMRVLGPWGALSACATGT